MGQTITKYVQQAYGDAWKHSLMKRYQQTNQRLNNIFMPSAAIAIYAQILLEVIYENGDGKN